MAKTKSTLTVPSGGAQIPAMAIRATQNETHIGVASWNIRDYRKGSVYVVPDYIGQHLIDHGIAVPADDDAEDDEWFDQTKETDAELAARVRATLLGGKEEADAVA